MGKQFEASSCKIEVVIDPSLVSKFHGRNDDVVKDVYIQLTMINKIFQKVNFGKKAYLSFLVRKISIFADEGITPLTKDGDLRYFARKHKPEPGSCLTIGFINNLITTENAPLTYYTGYVPKGDGGVCAAVGNTIIISHGNADTPAPMGLYLVSLFRSITRALGATDSGTGCSEGGRPSPMELVQQHIMAEEIEIVKTFGVFTACNMLEMEKTMLRSHCIEEYFKSSCGDSVRNEGEECDCGPPYLCESIDPCCLPPLLTAQGSIEDQKKAYKTGCKLRPDAKCSLSDGCCHTCQPIDLKVHCFSGPGTCDMAFCDGSSPQCPKGSEASEGLACSSRHNLTVEPLFCTGGKCEMKLCESASLEPCTCAALSEFECHACCIKDGTCQASQELGLFEGKTFVRPERTPCMGGLCLNGRCVISSKKQVFEPEVEPEKKSAGGKRSFQPSPPPVGMGRKLESVYIYITLIFFITALLIIV